jgi:hypothetical protein
VADLPANRFIQLCEISANCHISIRLIYHYIQLGSQICGLIILLDNTYFSFVLSFHSFYLFLHFSVE